MRATKRRIAALLAALLVIPSQPVWAVDLLPQSVIESRMLQETSQDKATGNDAVESVSTATSNDAFMDNEDAQYADGELTDDVNKASTSNAESKKAEDEVIFNTGNCAYSVVSFEDFRDNELGDAYFDENGNYTINIPEENPFFPYEVQFTHDGKTTEEWFMTPDDSVEVGGHTFKVSAYFDDTVVTQMSLEVAGKTVVVYPEKKEFVDGDGAIETSLLPLKERYLMLDMYEFTPVELTMVSINSLFLGSKELKNTDEVVWTYQGHDDYDISTSGAVVDLSYGTSSGYSSWEMIVGEADQLANDNIRYFVNMEMDETENWLIPSISKRDEQGKPINVAVSDFSYNDYYSERSKDTREEYIFISGESVTEEEQLYVNFEINPDIFNNETLHIVQGKYHSREELASSPIGGEAIVVKPDIASASDAIPSNVSFLMSEEDDTWVTVISYDHAGNATGCLPIYVWIEREEVREPHFQYSFRVKTDQGWEEPWYLSKTVTKDGYKYKTYTLYKDYPADGQYYFRMNYYNQYDLIDNSLVTAAFAGQYNSIDEATKAGSKNIRNELSNTTGIGGYAADYSKGVYLSVFVGEDGTKDQKVYHYCINTVEGTKASGSNGVGVDFNRLLDADGKYIPCYVVNKEDDSYAEYNYPTIFVNSDVDLTNLAPQFYTSDGVNLYAEGGSSPEISGKSYHDFTDGPVQYTAVAENGENSKNYWLQIVQVSDDDGNLFINSLADEGADTRKDGNTIYSTREMFLDGYHNYVHDILVANMGKNGISALSAELESDVVELDEYWTLKGKYELAALAAGSIDSPENLSKIRIKTKDGVETGSDITGTLTIKSGDTALIILTLTGIVGDPSIVTKEIPQAVKYVPYGTVIQNNSKYSWNSVSYSIVSGNLPQGMKLKSSGEFYGVPVEAGEFTFTVQLKNNGNSLGSTQKTFTMTVNENTDVNVEAATDEGYNLTQRIQDITLNSSVDQTMVSQGVYSEFVDLFLDGVKLQEGVDYDSESGSTRITIRSQTLKNSNTVGTHTLGIEFRTKDTNELKRAAQNYKITTSESNSGNNSGSSETQSSSGNSSGDSDDSVLLRDPKKGYMSKSMGIITGSENGYSKWQQDNNGWKLIYADGTTAAGSMVEQSDKTTVEHVLWEKVNGLWYAFGADGYVKSGWIYDYQSGKWYFMSPEDGMKTGWYTEPQDGCIYYLESSNGQLVTGWRQIDGKWYYFNDALTAPTWMLDEETGKWQYNVKSKTKPFGARLSNEKTPDGYTVGEDGVLMQ